MSILIQRAIGRIPEIPASRQILTGAGLSGGGDLSADRTLVNTGVLSLTGTANQVNASGSTGAITLSLPQSIHAGASPTFAALTLGVTPLALGSGGTGAATAADARTALGLGTMAVLSTPLSLTTNVDGTLQAAQFPALTGDLTTGAGALATTLATVNGNVGSFGSGTSIPTLTVNAKGLVTAASGNVVVAPAGTLTGATLAAGVLASSLTSVGTLLNLAVTNTITGSITGNAATVTTNANLTGHIISTGNAAVLGSFSSAQLLAAVTGGTGTGAAVFGTAPTFTTSLQVTNGTNSFVLDTATARLVITGTVATLGQMPRLGLGFSGDDDLAVGFLTYNHDNLALIFDAYHNGTSWVSSHAGSNFCIYKTGDQMIIGFNSGTAKGSTFGAFDLANGVIFSNNGRMGIGGAPGSAKLFVSGNLGIGTTTAASGVTYSLLSVNGAMLLVGASSVQEREMISLSPSYATSTDASRKARAILSVYDTAAREVLRGEASGTAPMISFLGAAAALQQTLNAAASDAATTQALCNQIRAALILFGLCN